MDSPEINFKGWVSISQVSEKSENIDNVSEKLEVKTKQKL